MILFLDFDGTTHPTPRSYTSGEDLFCRLPILESWLRQRPGIEVVISSSWREAHSVDEMRGYFCEDLQRRIIGATPVLKRDDWEQYDGELPPTRFERELEVQRWLRESGEPWRPWAALDDQAWLYRPFNPRLVLCDQKVGLTQRELDGVDQVLQHKP